VIFFERAESQEGETRNKIREVDHNFFATLRLCEKKKSACLPTAGKRTGFLGFKGVSALLLL
jgi:hypothetical protein